MNGGKIVRETGCITLRRLDRGARAVVSMAISTQTSKRDRGWMGWPVWRREQRGSAILVSIAVSRLSRHGFLQPWATSLITIMVRVSGLSSGATFLNAIRRLSRVQLNNTTSAPTENVMVDDSLARVERQIQGFDRAAASSTRSANPSSSGQREKYLQLPPHAEILPLVDSYFRHFRWYRMVLLVLLTGG